MSWLWSGVSETPSLAWHVVIYNDREYIPVIKCIGYKQNHGADPDWLPPFLCIFLKTVTRDKNHGNIQPDDVSSLNEPCVKLALYSTLAREAAA